MKLKNFAVVLTKLVIELLLFLNVIFLVLFCLYINIIFCLISWTVLHVFLCWGPLNGNMR